MALVLMMATPMRARHVSPEIAYKVATTFLNNNGSKTTQLNDLSKKAGFPNLYIFSTEQSFVVMSADDCVLPILGYSVTSMFRTESLPENISSWMQGYNDEIQYAIDNHLEATAETLALWEDLKNGKVGTAKANTVVNALIQTTWGQSSGYNDLCPYDSNAGERTVTGCVATAMAQIIKYWGHPLHGTGSHSYTPSSHPEYGIQSVNFGNATYYWEDMPADSSSSEVAKLMYHCGVSVDMNYDIYSNGGSSASYSKIITALSSYFYYQNASLKNKSNYSQQKWINMLKTELNASRPLLYTGNVNASIGHAFVCDGYNSSNYFHFNWGWNGSCDGFYTLTSLIPQQGGTGGNYNYTNEQRAIFGIQPVACEASAPINFTIATNDHNATLSWNAANLAESYNIYRNNELIANTNDTIYYETNLSSGSFDYYLKSKSNSGSLSSPSDTINILIKPSASDLSATKENGNVTLSWTAPEWGLPQFGDEFLTYGAGNYSNSYGYGGGTRKMYWGHKYPSSILEADKAIYKVSFYAKYTGDYKLFVYKGTATNYPQTKLLEQEVSVPTVGWFDIVLANPLFIDSSKDLWVFMYDTESRDYPAAYENYSGSNGNFYSINPLAYTYTLNGKAFLIRTYITNTSYTYDLYDNGVSILQNHPETNYTIPNLTTNTAHQFTVKIDFPDGDSPASNMAGITVGTATLSQLELSANDKMTVTEGSCLTVSGTISNSNASNLVLEDGAQLINDSYGVLATVKKTILPYSINQSDGWHLIASPMTEALSASNITELLSNNYDLYAFEQSEDNEWRNHEAQNFTIVNGGGYLYANSGNTTISFSGTLETDIITTPLTYDADAKVKGFNLIGNPYPCNAYVDRSFYVLNSNGSDFTLGSNPIPPCAAILVQAQGTGERVTFSKTASKNEPNITFSVVKADTKDNAIFDKVRICFNDTKQLTKYNLSQQCSGLYIPQNGQNLAVACSNGANEMPINFKAAQDGAYTLNFEVENMEISYLHLIDNITGDDIDLLAMPSYTFNAKTMDPVERFKIAIE